jgi:vacuolar-type H+-ATPase subunit F/Vma7
MSKLVFIGDEVSAAGWRLAGVDVTVPPQGAEESTLLKHLPKEGMLIITAEVADCISPALLEQILTSTSLLTHVVGDIQGQHQVTDYAGKLRTQLGLGQ